MSLRLLAKPPGPVLCGDRGQVQRPLLGPRAKCFSALSPITHPRKVLPKSPSPGPAVRVPFCHIQPAGSSGRAWCPGAGSAQSSGQRWPHARSSSCRAWRAWGSSLCPAPLPRPSPHRLQQGVGLVQLLLTQPSLHLQLAHDALKTLQSAVESKHGPTSVSGDRLPGFPPQSTAPSCSGPPCRPVAHS